MFLPGIVSSTVKLFADDTIYRPIQDIQDKEIIQQDLDNLYKWSQVWQLPFSVEKCNVLHIEKNNNNQAYSLNSHNLQQVLEEKDLGVTFDSRLQFSTHTAGCTSKANQRIELLPRNFKFLDEETFLPFYKTLVRPILEYGYSVWKPYFKKDSELLEKVQRRSTKLVRPIKTVVISLD